MGRTPCCKDEAVKRGPWTKDEDKKLMDYIKMNGHGSWRRLPELAGLNRCGKSCRLRWTNYLRPDIKRGSFSEEEEKLIIDLHSVLGNKWSSIATRLPGRTDNEIKNYWNTHLRKKLLQKGIDPVTHRPRTDLGYLANFPSLLAAANLSNLQTSQWNMNALQLQAEAAQLLKLQLASNLIQVLTAAGSSTANPIMDSIALFGSPSPSLIGGYQPRELQLPDLVQGSPPLNSESSIPMTPWSVACPNSELLASIPKEQPATAATTASAMAVCCSSDNAQIEMSGGSDCTRSSSFPVSDITSTTSPVSGSPEITQVEQIASDDGPMRIFDTWDIFAHDGEDFGWKEMLEQMSWPKAS